MVWCKEMAPPSSEPFAACVLLCSWQENADRRFRFARVTAAWDRGGDKKVPVQVHWIVSSELAVGSKVSRIGTGIGTDEMVVVHPGALFRLRPVKRG